MSASKMVGVAAHVAVARLCAYGLAHITPVRAPLSSGATTMSEAGFRTACEPGTTRGSPARKNEPDVTKRSGSGLRFHSTGTMSAAILFPEPEPERLHMPDTKPADRPPEEKTGHVYALGLGFVTTILPVVSGTKLQEEVGLRDPGAARSSAGAQRRGLFEHDTGSPKPDVPPSTVPGARSLTSR
jgi:hypothetical protein